MPPSRGAGNFSALSVAMGRIQARQNQEARLACGTFRNLTFIEVGSFCGSDLRASISDLRARIL